MKLPGVQPLVLLPPHLLFGSCMGKIAPVVFPVAASRPVSALMKLLLMSRELLPCRLLPGELLPSLDRLSWLSLQEKFSCIQMWLLMLNCLGAIFI